MKRKAISSALSAKNNARSGHVGSSRKMFAKISRVIDCHRVGFAHINDKIKAEEQIASLRNFCLSGNAGRGALIDLTTFSNTLWCLGGQIARHCKSPRDDGENFETAELSLTIKNESERFIHMLVQVSERFSESGRIILKGEEVKQFDRLANYYSALLDTLDVCHINKATVAAQRLTDQYMARANRQRAKESASAS